MPARAPGQQVIGDSQLHRTHSVRAARRAAEAWAAGPSRFPNGRCVASHAAIRWWRMDRAVREAAGFNLKAAQTSGLAQSVRRQRPHMRDAAFAQCLQVIAAFKHRHDSPLCMAPGDRDNLAGQPGEVFGV